MLSFHVTEPLWQILLLVFSLFTVLTLASTILFLFRQKCRGILQIGLSIILVLNMALYVMMQMDNSLLGPERDIPLQVPYIVLAAAVLVSLVFDIQVLLGETKKRKTIRPRSIKESFDNLPTGVCFFNEAGLPVLCNRTMHQFSFDVCGKDVQFVTDLVSCLNDNTALLPGIRKDGNVFVLSDGNAWQMEVRFITDESGEIYTQYIATNVSDLYRKREELTRENAELRKAQQELKKLSANVVTVTREEEILNTKMRVHDEMGRCLIAAQKYLQEERIDGIPDDVAYSWKRAVSMVKYNNDIPDEDMLSQIRKACESVKIDFVQTGELPEKKSDAYVFTCAIRECVTNAVRYAEAKALYAAFDESADESVLTVTNDGKIPEKEITEGGGLSTLRRRIERAGGQMQIQSKPYFKLTVTIPKEKEEVL